MKTQKLGQEAAFATSCENLQSEQTWQSGMSKRFYAACAAMQGIVSNNELRHALALDSSNAHFNPEKLSHDAFLIKYAYQLADELLRQEGG